jgi:glycine dehydrogenase subunit 1
MDFISNKNSQNKEMLEAIGVSKLEELFESIPEKLRLPPPEHDDGLSEYEVLCLMEELAKKNTFTQLVSYLGAGAYEHHVPALVSAVTSKSEFLTSYTPYQAEASQGMLQLIFEFQSAICALTGLDVSNASLYDGASACAEALLMTLRLQKEKNRVIIAGSLNPSYRGVVDQYLQSHHTEIVTVPFKEDGSLNLDELEKALDTTTAGILIQSPNFFGILEDVKSITAKAKEKDILSILCANPLSYGLFASAGDLGVDIAVGDCQPFGLPLHFGGPYVGYIACRSDLVRQLPGRIIGETVDTEKRRGFVLTLQAREQHIRREKATSNICTNQALAALACLVAILWYGRKGIPKLALTNYQRTQYLKQKLEALGYKTLGGENVFNEFAISFNKNAEDVQKQFLKHEIEPGLSLGVFYPELRDYFLVSVTETKSKKQLDNYLEVAGNLERNSEQSLSVGDLAGGILT